eukprot:TRINITY_DN2862_c0_g1_i4.p2 TRINITY_DN2862_c0_g1~~TRINITY_DN2862_c0_g1_i4.p2  ORF type:complete len:473 (-),score=60.64 TRINITY_DN2862_c0_g1_i4:9-1427(-)
MTVLNFKGYARAGLLYDSGLKTVPGIGDWNKQTLGRLGNENDLYLEAELVKSVKSGKAWSKYHMLMAGKTYNNPTWDDAASGLHVRNSFIEMGGLDFAPTATFWIGKRFYGRDDIHITDVYWRDMSGTGAGVQNLLNGALDVALIGGSGQGTDDDGLNNSNINLDVRYRFSGFEVEGTLGLRDGADDVNSTNPTTNFQMAGIYNMSNFFGIGAGFSKVALQYGVNMQNWALGKCEWNGGSDANGTGPDGANTLRFVTYGVTEMGNWQIMPSLVYNMDMPDEGDDTSDLTLAVRPQMVVNNNFLVAFEGAFFMQDNGTDTNNKMKFAVAPTLKLDATGFWNRPELRAILSYVSQEDFGAVNGKGDDDEIRLGFQAETWFQQVIQKSVKKEKKRIRKKEKRKRVKKKKKKKKKNPPRVYFLFKTFYAHQKKQKKKYKESTNIKTKKIRKRSEEKIHHQPIHTRNTHTHCSKTYS